MWPGRGKAKRTFFSDEGVRIGSVGRAATDGHLKTGPKDDVALLAFISVKIGPIHRDAPLAASEAEGARHCRQCLEYVVEPGPSSTWTETAYSVPQGQPNCFLMGLKMLIGFVG